MQGKHAPLPCFALDGRTPAVKLRDVLDDRQAESRPAELAAPSRIDPVKSLENPVKMLAGNSTAVIPNADDRFVVADDGLDGDGLPRPRCT